MFGDIVLEVLIDKKWKFALRKKIEKWKNQINLKVNEMFSEPPQLFIANIFCHYNMSYEVILCSWFGEIQIFSCSWELFRLSWATKMRYFFKTFRVKSSIRSHLSNGTNIDMFEHIVLDFLIDESSKFSQLKNFEKWKMATIANTLVANTSQIDENFFFSIFSFI